MSPIRAATAGSLLSLTGHLTAKDSPVRDFVMANLPPDNARALNEAISREIAGGPKIAGVPLGAGEHGLIGTAFDYRLRYWFANTPAQELVAAAGVQRLGRAMVAGDPAVRTSLLRAPVSKGHAMILYQAGADLLARVDRVVRELRPEGRRLELADEQKLDRYCLALAMMEQVRRVGLRPGSPLLVEPIPSSAKELLARARKAWLDDLRDMAWAWDECARREGLATSPVVLNPTFTGSRDVAGADADLIVDGCLIEIKTTIQAKLRDPVLQQLFGYLLLDFDDLYRIRSVGVYLARHGRLLRWPLEQLLGSRAHELTDLRYRFRSLLRTPATAF